MTVEHKITLTSDAADEVRELLRTLDIQVQAAFMDGAAGRLIRSLLRPGFRLTLESPAEDEHNPLVLARLLNFETGEGGVVISGPDLVETLDRVAAQLDLRRCTRCQTVLPTSAFSKLTSGPGGFNRSCLQCERKRVAAYGKKTQHGTADGGHADE